MTGSLRDQYSFGTVRWVTCPKNWSNQCVGFWDKCRQARCHANARLKKLVANLSLDKAFLEEALGKQ